MLDGGWVVVVVVVVVVVLVVAVVLVVVVAEVVVIEIGLNTRVTQICTPQLPRHVLASEIGFSTTAKRPTTVDPNQTSLLELSCLVGALLPTQSAS